MTGFSRTQEIVHDIGATGRFVLRVTSADIEVRRTDGDTVRVAVQFDIRASDETEADRIFEEAKFRVQAAGGSLEITEPEREEGSGLGALARLLGDRRSRPSAEMVVAEVPERANVTVAGVSADLVVSGLSGSQHYRTVSGDAVLNDVSGAIQVGSVSGEISLRGVGPIVLRANTVSGDLIAFASRLERTRVVTVSGDVELEGELAPDGEHRIETVSGDLGLGAVNGMTLEVRGLSSNVSISLPHRSEGTRDRRRYVIGDGGARLLFSSMSGDVRVGN
ncbi:MAG TPA: DUF4097 family beta strand repeat-containing protein, partial [Candidatus Limnocylindrales bacterium]|nr:DUF4097 family beta strand repeat-containing protein [Candidatus Limnocylindrales bacterium]